MLASGKINADEADRLLNAVDSGQSDHVADQQTSTVKPKFLHVKVEKNENGGEKNVDIKIPLLLLKAGVKLGSIMPGDAKDKINSQLNEKGIMFDLNNVSSKEIDVLIKTLTESSIDIDTEDEKVKIYCA